MEFFRIHKTIPFMHYRHVLNLISLVSFIVAVFWIFTHGLAFSIEFTGGTQMEVRYPSAANTEQVRQDLKAVSNEVLVQTFGTASDIVIRVPTKQGYTSGQVAFTRRPLKPSSPVPNTSVPRWARSLPATVARRLRSSWLAS